MGIIVKELVGQHVDNTAYCLGRCVWASKRVSDALYVSKLPHLNPILVEAQCDMDADSIARLFSYSLQLKQEYSQLPKVLVISIKSITTGVKSKFKNLENNCMYTMDCDFWAESCQILSAKSIQAHLKGNPLNKLVALGHFLI
ncbi:hypothetical protein BCV72DRAFT_222400 [Rhizopus microsporus var. microsporus]|uniref:Uncharacterized protein n=2 Tax=Rhizopus microsporus TaxID=58291 RepID=A0A2G4T8K5_RHIZD|nr:uncharacterized protein RHIMIDRAFT_253729 [Rhizopus microsporus ATCC 52813]ORE09859.1 hypothetical protein BCV72DRAFT_222400 [Rhizopus microsporus var. microsporus]PHZ17339.1 hypothetical protein RHIMIDRAFT_253729 [Rhizopus microsporus ATCC 52813]